MGLTRRITDAVADAVTAGKFEAATAGIPGPWLLVGAVTGEDGRTHDFLAMAPGTSTREALGLLDMAHIVVSGRVSAQHLD